MTKKATFSYVLFASILVFTLSFNANTIQGQSGPEFVFASHNIDPEHIKNLESLIDQMNQKGYDLKTLMEDPRFELYEGMTQRFTRSAERKTPTLDEYKVILGYDLKKQNIRNFIEENRDQLNQAEREYDIPKYVIAAIIGVESDFGRNTGSFNPLNAYVSMIAENYRAEFATAQLEELLKFTSDREMDVFELNSSYAGAMTYAQFIPYSLNRWWVGNDLTSMENNILSVANYLAHFKNITGSVERAVYRYNPSQLYTNAVLSLASDAEKMFE
jgi:membrane-bound lytic murein transglycosylase B